MSNYSLECRLFTAFSTQLFHGIYSTCSDAWHQLVNDNEACKHLKLFHRYWYYISRFLTLQIFPSTRRRFWRRRCTFTILQTGLWDIQQAGKCYGGFPHRERGKISLQLCLCTTVVQCVICSTDIFTDIMTAIAGRDTMCIYFSLDSNRADGVTIVYAM